MNVIERLEICTLSGNKDEAGEKVELFQVNAPWLLLLVFLTGSCFLAAEIISVAMFLCSLFLLADPYKTRKRLLFPGIGFFLIIMLVGMRGIANNIPYDVAKDIWYTGNPALTLLFGSLLAKKMDGLRPVLRAFVAAAIIVALLHFCRFLLNPSYLHESLPEIQTQIGAGYLLSALGIGIAIGDMRYSLGILPSRTTAWSLIALCLLSVTLSFSRTLWISLLTLVLVALAIDNFWAALRVLIAAMAVTVIGLSAVNISKLESANNSHLTFIDKISYSLQEMQISNYDEMADINKNWRGFESFRAIQTYVSGSPTDYLIGKGFGTNVELGFTMVLANEEFEHIPVLHNGYLYILVKTGVVGLAAYLLYLLLTFRTGKRLARLPDPEARLCGFLLISLTIIMLETTMVVAGMFNKSWVFPATLFVGLLMGYAEFIAMKSAVQRVKFAGDADNGSKNIHPDS